ncbi:hypothetical protein TREMEDRAFT_60759 [Tremella mesenterica DSM 1558]|uniref:uncharacterized protein n=1 Tax=Tremella mesenterica (strain ATCC 24925 / CBS 8224 / DSM 1558 / NBRC 9311 / NRRL Y-6157 / RJB 2259-6 / UBC 559-6) TaxID=578456 RepID=UPI0003F48FFF|nr:uncharacterized protein TREMEDRAFT_60759 [Tremella mesenterica DSM 1558]EIW71839.1 hypothetical protein TREMEDRAFT_60759 [Tremella mesenterica DSM 1558]
MSRTANATPPPQPYFPPRNATPSMRHSTAIVPSLHMHPSRQRPHPQHAHGKKRSKHLSSATAAFGALTPRKAKTGDSPASQSTSAQNTPLAEANSSSSALSARSVHSISSATFTTDNTDHTDTDIDIDFDSGRATPTPSFATATTRHSTAETDASSSVLITPASSQISFPLDLSIISATSSISSDHAPAIPVQKPSWVPNLSFGKMARAVVDIGMGFSEKRSKKDSKDKDQGAQVSTPTPVSARLGRSGSSRNSTPTPVKAKEDERLQKKQVDGKQQSIQLPSPITRTTHTVPTVPAVETPLRAAQFVTPVGVNRGEQAIQPDSLLFSQATPQPQTVGNDARAGVAFMHAEWFEAQRQRMVECARLCSQWPQSGYNLLKFGPAGSKQFYEPQSYANPQYVASLMERQAQLERQITETESLFFSSSASARSSGSLCGSRSSSESGDSLSVQATSSSQSSSFCCQAPVIPVDRAESSDDMDQRTAEIRAAMSSPLMPVHSSDSQVSLMETTGSGIFKHAELGSVVSDTMDIDTDISSVPSSTSFAHNHSFASSLLTLGSSLEMSITRSSLEPPKSHLNQESSQNQEKDDDDILRTRPFRAQSCGSKRPSPSAPEEEEKRRKVDEAMVVEEAVSTGVIQPVTRNEWSASVPDLTKATSSSSTVFSNQENSVTTFGNSQNLSSNLQIPPTGQVFGMVVKTSDTHPIILSPFVPSKLVPVLAAHLVRPSVVSQKPLLLSSTIDVPSLLLSFTPPSVAPMPNGLLPNSVATGLDVHISSFPSVVPEVGRACGVNQSLGYPTVGRGQSFGVNSGDNSIDGVSRNSLGNLLLSSCPGKRLRMDGPVKGRGPVCRDLETDLRRIKNEGVGCLVCCLDDAELALLGVPWDTYRSVATSLGMDVLRFVHFSSLPMPDGFTPVSLELFDTQVGLIVKNYSLEGINVLAHCRGGVGRAGLTACAWALKMGFVQPHPSLTLIEHAALSTSNVIPVELEHQIVMSMVERVIAMIRARRGLKAIESFEQVQFLAAYVRWLRAAQRD